MRVSQDSNNQVNAGAPSVADGRTQAFGSWTYRVDDATLSWNDDVFVLFGLAVNEVVPTLSLMSSHQHPEDRPTWDEQLRSIAVAGLTVSVWHRIIDAHTNHRTVHTVLSAVVDDDGSVREVRGLMTDLTARVDRERSRAANEAVARSAQSRGVIDQAKGIIMATMDVDDEIAFDLLRWHSSHMNIKLRDVAVAVVGHRSELTDSNPASTPRERLTAAITGLAAVREPALLAGRNLSDPAIDIDIHRETSRTSRIAPSNLAGTMLRAVAVAAQSVSIADYEAPDQPLVYVNRAFEELTGYRAEDILGRNCRFLQGSDPVPETEGAAVASLREAITEGRESRTVVRNYRQDGTAFWNELQLSAVRNATGTVTHYIGYQTDVSERVVRDQQLEHLASHDARTNLPNQAAAAARLDRLLDAGDDIPAPAVLRLHLSGFRATDRIDDPLAIRTVLVTAALRLQAALGPSVYLAKLDDDAFLVVLADAHGLDTALQGLTDPIQLEHGEIRLVVRVEEVGRAEVEALAHPPADLTAIKE